MTEDRYISALKELETGAENSVVAQKYEIHRGTLAQVYKGYCIYRDSVRQVNQAISDDAVLSDTALSGTLSSDIQFNADYISILEDYDNAKLELSKLEEELATVRQVNQAISDDLSTANEEIARLRKIEEEFLTVRQVNQAVSDSGNSANEEIARLNSDLSTANTEIVRLNDELITANAELSTVRQNLKNLEETSKNNGNMAEIEELKSKLLLSDKASCDFEKRLSLSDNENKGLQEKLSTANETISRLNNDLSTAKQELTRLRKIEEDFSTVRQVNQAVSDNQNSANTELARLRNDLNTAKAELSTVRQNLEKAETQLKSSIAPEKLSAVQQDLLKNKEFLESVTAERDKLAKQLQAKIGVETDVKHYKWGAIGIACVLIIFLILASVSHFIKKQKNDYSSQTLQYQRFTGITV